MSGEAYANSWAHPRKKNCLCILYFHLPKQSFEMSEDKSLTSQEAVILDSDPAGFWGRVASSFPTSAGRLAFGGLLPLSGKRHARDMSVPDPLWDQGALSAPCLVGLQLLQTEASDWSLWNAGRPGRSYCSLGEHWGAAATKWSRAGPSSTMAGMSACTLWGRKAEAAIFSNCVAQPFLCQCDGLGGSRPQLWNVTGHTTSG